MLEWLKRFWWAVLAAVIVGAGGMLIAMIALIVSQYGN